jgi:PIN domain nuclease of toxin-antitoxin system
LLWLIDAPRQFSAAAAAALHDPSAILYASHASLWEIVLKHRAGKLKLPMPPREYWAELVDAWVLTELQITPDVLLQVGNVPLHHKDPFDHVLIAHAQLSVFAHHLLGPSASSVRRTDHLVASPQRNRPAAGRFHVRTSRSP